MTKEQFKCAMQRGLGSCVVELKNTDNIEKYRDLVAWGCTHEMAYDAQCEGCRSFYLYELISQFPEASFFLDIVGKRLHQCMKSNGWEFMQDCEILAFFANDGNQDAILLLQNCYKEMLHVLLHKHRYPKNGVFSERDNFEALCISLVSQCHGDKMSAAQQYKTIVHDLGMLIQNNVLYSAADFEWFQAVSENEIGKKTIDKLLNYKNATEASKVYLSSWNEYLKENQNKKADLSNVDIKTADEIYIQLKNGEHFGNVISVTLGRKLEKNNKQDEVKKLAIYYKNEKSDEVRSQLLRLLANEECAYSLDVQQLMEDSKSLDAGLSSWAFQAMSYRKSEEVRNYALNLLQKEEHIAEAISMLVANYRSEDHDYFVKMTKQIPVSYNYGEWHAVFSDVLDLIKNGTMKNRPKELLIYMYENTLCSYCRENIVKEMGRRRMLTKDLLEELLYDCNDEIRAYACKRLKSWA